MALCTNVVPDSNAYIIYFNYLFSNQLSPKKTMEGYIGGGILTVIIGTAFTALCVEYGYPSIICPVKVNDKYLAETISGNEQSNPVSRGFLLAPECNLPDTFLPQNYQVVYTYPCR